MNLLGVCPTLNRPAMLSRLRHSAASGTVQLPLLVSEETAPRALTSCINDLLAKARDRNPDVVFLLGDHIVFDRHCVAEVARIFDTYMPSTMGAVGMRIANLPGRGASPYAFMAVGAGLLDSFPDWQAFCPDYYHFCADTELGEYAEWLGVFTLAEHATISTYSPAAGNMRVDATYRAGRCRKAQDFRVRAERQHQGLLWGRDFESAKQKQSNR